MEEVEKQEKNCSCLAGAQDPTWFQILNPVLSDTNEGINGICSNSADTLLSNFFLQEEEENKEVDKGEGIVVERMREMTTTL